MKREQALTELQKYFDIRELVNRDVYARFGQTAWRFFDTELIETLLALRTKILCVPLICNNWHTGGTFTQRGLRVNTSPLVADKTERNVLYVSAHLLGKGVDLSSKKMTADEMRTAIQAQQSKLPYKVRIEKSENAPTWLHIDIMHTGGAQKIEWF